MDINILLYIISLLPISWIVIFKQEQLSDSKFYRKWLIISIIILTCGVIFEFYNKESKRSLFFFGSQLLLIFLLIQKPLRNYYVKKYNREPEFSKFTTNTPDKIYSTILYFSIIILPFLIDEITKKLLNILKIKL